MIVGFRRWKNETYTQNWLGNLKITSPTTGIADFICPYDLTIPGRNANYVPSNFNIDYNLALVAKEDGAKLKLVASSLKEYHDTYNSSMLIITHHPDLLKILKDTFRLNSLSFLTTSNYIYKFRRFSNLKHPPIVEYFLLKNHSMV